jgi:hypothetical protein
MDFISNTKKIKFIIVKTNPFQEREIPLFFSRNMGKKIEIYGIYL